MNINATGLRFGAMYRITGLPDETELYTSKYEDEAYQVSRVPRVKGELLVSIDGSTQENTATHAKVLMDVLRDMLSDRPPYSPTYEQDERIKAVVQNSLRRMIQFSDVARSATLDVTELVSDKSSFDESI